ncbi:hypothetical protein Tco_0467852 [Tanacetum coccineum]
MKTRPCTLPNHTCTWVAQQHQFTFIKTILLKKLNIPPPDRKVYRNRGKAIATSSDSYFDQNLLEEAGVQLNAEPADWKDDTDDESEEHELEAHYMYMAQLQEVTPDPVDNSRPIFDDEPMHKVQNNNDNYNVFAMENEHPEQPESSNDIYLAEQGDTNITIASSDICYDRAQDDQDK